MKPTITTIETRLRKLEGIALPVPAMTSDIQERMRGVATILLDDSLSEMEGNERLMAYLGRCPDPNRVRRIRELFALARARRDSGTWALNPVMMNEVLQ